MYLHNVSLFQPLRMKCTIHRRRLLLFFAIFCDFTHTPTLLVFICDLYCVSSSSPSSLSHIQIRSREFYFYSVAFVVILRGATYLGQTWLEWHGSSSPNIEFQAIESRCYFNICTNFSLIQFLWKECFEWNTGGFDTFFFSSKNSFVLIIFIFYMTFLACNRLISMFYNSKS